MRGVVRPVVLSALAAGAVCVALGILWSVGYWGYPFNSPSFASWLEPVTSVDGYEEFNTAWQGESNAPREGRRALIETARFYEAYGTDFESGKLAFELQQKGRLPASDTGIRADIFKSVCRELDRSGVLYPGSPGYPDAKRLYGAIAAARARDGSNLLIAALGGSETSNDHYPRYQALFRMRGSKPELTEYRRYFVDIAGIEGANWWLVATALGTVLVPLAAATTLLCFVLSQRRSRSRIA